MEINILHLYSDLMNLYGDYANLVVLSKHLKDQGIKTNIVKKSVGDSFTVKDYDLIYIGHGTDKSLIALKNDIIKYKDELKDYIDSNRFMLLTGNSLEILNGSCLNIIPFKKYEGNRITKDEILTTNLIKEKVIGFYNYSGNIENNEYPLFNNGEGIKYKNIYATYLSGPLLVRNPYFLNYFIKTLVTSKYKKFKFKNIKYNDETESYKIALFELENR